MVSPLCQVKDGAGAYGPTTGGVNVTPGDVISIQLISTAGVGSWSISCIGTDELSNAATVTSALSIDNLNKIATFTAPVAGRTYIFQSKVNGGVDINGTPQPTYTTTFAIFTLAASGNRCLAANETTEGNATFGWIADINPGLRVNGPAAYGSTGTQTIAAQELDSSVDAKGTEKDRMPVHAQTTDATVTTLDSWTLNSGTAVVVTATVCAIKSDSSQAGGWSVSATFRNNAGTVSQLGSTLVTVIGTLDNAAWVATLDFTGTTIRIRVTGVAATTIQWSAISTRLEVIP